MTTAAAPRPGPSQEQVDHERHHPQHDHDHSHHYHDHSHGPDHGHQAGGDLRQASGSSLIGRLRPLLALLRPQRRLLVAVIVAGAANQLLAIASAVVGAYLVGRAATGATSDELASLLVVLVLLIVPRALMPWLESMLNHLMAFRVLVDVRGRVHAAFERLAPGYLIKRRSGDLGAAVVADVELLELFFAHTLGPLVVAATVPLAALITLALFHWSLPLVLLPVLVVVTSVPGWLQAKAVRQGREVRAAAGEVNAEVVDGIQGLREVVAFGDQDGQLRTLDAAGHRLLDAQVGHGRRLGVERASVDTLVVCGMLAVLAVAGALVTAGAMDQALLPPAVVLAAFTFAPVTTVVEVANELNLVAASGERLLTVLHEQAPVEDRVHVAPVAPINPDISFHGVVFGYSPEGPAVLNDVDFTVAAGETVALVGHSGAGKSTAAHLLLRFWDVSAGVIQVGGHDIRDLPQHTLRQLVTFVPQDVYLFNASVADNIRLGKADATDAEVEAAARASLAHEFINALPEGYATVTGERGAQLSGGQRQRIALARALLKDAPILVMDEAVSNLDAESEQLLIAAMADASAGRTTLVIAHRLSTIRTADRLVVLDRGRVAETGTHDDLVARGGVYARLVASQTNGAIDST